MSGHFIVKPEVHRCFPMNNSHGKSLETNTVWRCDCGSYWRFSRGSNVWVSCSKRKAMKLAKKYS